MEHTIGLLGLAQCAAALVCVGLSVATVASLRPRKVTLREGALALAPAWAGRALAIVAFVALALVSLTRDANASPYKVRVDWAGAVFASDIELVHGWWHAAQGD
jgi:hypothetical protein